MRCWSRRRKRRRRRRRSRRIRKRRRRGKRKRRRRRRRLCTHTIIQSVTIHPCPSYLVVRSPVAPLGVPALHGVPLQRRQHVLVVALKATHSGQLPRALWERRVARLALSLEPGKN